MAFPTKMCSAYVKRQPVQAQHVFTLFSRFTLWLKRDFQAISSMASLFLALVLFPEVHKLAQAELDSVISRDRLPTSDDRPRLPYIEAISKELNRWHMVTPMGAGCRVHLHCPVLTHELRPSPRAN